jgi:O-antigen ligase
MPKSIDSTTGTSPGGSMGAILATSVLLSISLLLICRISAPHVVLLGALFFFATSVIALMGDITEKLVYSFFLIQITAATFMELSLYVTLICAMFFIPLLLLNNCSKIADAIPFRRSMFLLLAGWLMSLVYVNVFSYSYRKFMMMYDVYLLLGFSVAYMIFILLKLKYLDAKKLLFYIALSGLIFVGCTFALYFYKGYAGRIFIGRFGMPVNINPNFLALYLIMALSCTCFTALFEKQNIVKKYLMYAISAVYAVIILMTASRGPLLGLAVIIAYLLWYKRSIKLIALSLPCFAIVFFTMGSKVIVRMFTPTTSDLLSDFGRIQMLQAAFRILRDNHYVFGIGMNNYAWMKFDYGFPLWFDPARNQGFSSHNLFMEVWLGWGILGLIGWLAFNIGIIHKLFRCKNEEYKSVIKAIVFAMISFLLYGLVDSNIGNYSMMFTYFTLIGIAFFIITQKPNPVLTENFSKNL